MCAQQMLSKWGIQTKQCNVEYCRVSVWIWESELFSEFLDKIQSNENDIRNYDKQSYKQNLQMCELSCHLLERKICDK